jgi:hypothetical protein
MSTSISTLRRTPLARLALAASLAAALAACGAGAAPTAPRAASPGLHRDEASQQPPAQSTAADSTRARTEGNYQNPPV